MTIKVIYLQMKHLKNIGYRSMHMLNRYCCKMMYLLHKLYLMPNRAKMQTMPNQISMPIFYIIHVLIKMLMQMMMEEFFSNYPQIKVPCSLY